MCRNKHKLFIQDLGEASKHNPKRFWSNAKSKLGRKSLPPEKFHNGSKLSSSGDQAGGFNKNFHSVFGEATNNTINSDVADSHPDLSSVTITVDQVKNILQKLDVNKSCGPDDISPILLKCFSQYLSPSLSSLFNRSLRDGELPNDWLNANVCPVYKDKGDKNCVDNYRPISLLSVVSKVAERCMYNNVSSVMGESIFKDQHGFMKGRSTTTQLTQIFHIIGESVDNHGQFDAIYLDFSKAFDRVPHHLLLHKMKTCGFNGNLLK